MVRRWGWAGTLSAALAACSSASSGDVSTRGISDGLPASSDECTGELEFVPLANIQKPELGIWWALDPNSRQIYWNQAGDGVVQNYHWSPEQGLTALDVGALETLWGGSVSLRTYPALEFTSADGNVAVGGRYEVTATGDLSSSAGFRWASGSDLRALDFAPGAVNRDGSVIVGRRGEQLVRWTERGGVRELGLTGSLMRLSPAGDVIAGDDEQGCFRWSEAAGREALGALDPTTPVCAVQFMNETAEVLVGEALAPRSDAHHAFRWTPASGMQDLQLTDAAGRPARLDAMNAQGTVIVGSVRPFADGTSRLVRWTEATGAQEIGASEDGSFHASYVSPSGDVVIGDLLRAPQGEPQLVIFRWTEADGLQELGRSDNGVAVALDGQLLITNGATGPQILRFGELGASAAFLDLIPAGIVPEGWSEPQLLSVSADGRLLFGEARDGQGQKMSWLLHARCPEADGNER